MTNAAKIEVIVEQTPPITSDPTAKDKAIIKHRELTDLKGKLDTMIDTMAHNPSYLSRASIYWGNIPLWQKIVAGIILIVPAMIISIVFQLILVFTITTFALFIYTASSLLLDEHYNQNIDTTASLKTTIANLADTLGAVILSFEKLREGLVAQVERFEKENTTLQQSMDHFKGQVSTLTQRNKELEGVVKSLQQTEHDLGVERDRAIQASQKQSKLLERNEELLNQARLNLEKTQEELSQKVTALTNINKGLSTELTQTKAVADILKDSVSELSKIAGLTPEQVTVFNKRIIQFINNKEESFLLILKDLRETGRKLSVTQLEIDEAAKHMQSNVSRGARLEERLENATNPPASGTAALIAQMGVLKGDAKARASTEGSNQPAMGM